MNQVPESRTYTHDRCEQVTDVSGNAFTNLASPLAGLETTYCNACKGMFPVSEYRWTDSNETLTDYHQRHGKNANGFDRFIASKSSILAALLTAGILGILAFAFFFWGQGGGFVSSIACGIGTSVISLIAMAAILVSVLTPLVHKRACGVSDPRELV